MDIEIFRRLEPIVHEQKRNTDGLFAEFATSDTWVELVSCAMRDRRESFNSRMLKAAAIAIWAYEENVKAEEALRQPEFPELKPDAGSVPSRRRVLE